MAASAAKGKLPQSFTGPGLVDLQVNGFAGFDFNGDPDTWTVRAFLDVARALGRRGVAAALPTFFTDAMDRMTARARRFAELLAEEPQLAGVFPGLHIEGPFISPEDGPRGIHPREHCAIPAGAPDFFDRLQEASGARVKLLTLAPELDGALDLIARARIRGVCVAIGHTQAPAETIRAAVSAGAAMSTHLGNGSHHVLPRLDNYIQTQLAEDDLYASFIADGHHVPFATLKNFIRAKTTARSVLVSDATSGAGAEPGRYTLGSMDVVVSDDLCVTHPGTAGFAGSALTLDRAVVNACRECGVPFGQAWSMASMLPAALINLDPPEPVTVMVADDGFSEREDTYK
jgi:N-acetylglucosamine-6-phosphate deacetylase